MKPAPVSRKENSGDLTCGERRGQQTFLSACPIWLKWLLCAAMLCGSVGCKTSAPAEDVFRFRPRADPFAQLPPQLLVHVHVLAVREMTEASLHHPFPQLGFQLKDATLAPSSRLTTLAGTEVPQEALEAWIRRLNQADAARLCLDTRLMVDLAHESTASNVRDVQYTANWQLHPDGTRVQERGTFKPGTELAIRAVPIEDTDAFLLNFKLDMSAGRLEGFSLIKGPIPGKEGYSFPLKIQLPRKTCQSIATSVPVRDGYSLILAHHVKQFRTRTGAIRKGIREHMIYIVSATRIGQWIGPARDAVSGKRPRRYALNVLWGLWQGGKAPPTSAARSRETRPASGDDSQASFAGIDPKQLRDTLQTLANAQEALTCTLGIAIGEGQAASLNVGEVHTYVPAITPPPTPSSDTTHRFRVKEAQAGMILKAGLKRRERHVVTNLYYRLGDLIHREKVSRKLPSIRMPPGKRSPERYHFSICRQAYAESEADIDWVPGEILRIQGPWQYLDGHIIPEDRHREGFLTLQEMPSAPTAESGSPPRQP